MTCCRCFEWIRSKVSTNKRRFTTKEGYSLDLSYVTNRIIALGFPANGQIEKYYRNPRSAVMSFLTERHGNMLKLYNLCAEPDYSYSVEDVKPCSLARFPFYDHGVCGSIY